MRKNIKKKTKNEVIVNQNDQVTNEKKYDTGVELVVPFTIVDPEEANKVKGFSDIDVSQTTNVVFDSWATVPHEVISCNILDKEDIKSQINSVISSDIETIILSGINGFGVLIADDMFDEPYNIIAKDILEEYETFNKIYGGMHIRVFDSYYNMYSGKPDHIDFNMYIDNYKENIIIKTQNQIIIHLKKFRNHLTRKSILSGDDTFKLVEAMTSYTCRIFVEYIEQFLDSYFDDIYGTIKKAGEIQDNMNTRRVIARNNEF